MTDTEVNSLIINTLTKQQYDAIQTKSPTELYFVVDEVDATPIDNSANYVTSGGVKLALDNKIDKVTGATSGNIAIFNTTGGIVDSGYQCTDYALASVVQNSFTEIQTNIASISGLPAVGTSDTGKILMVVNGEWTLVSPSVLYSGSGVPNNTQGNNGDIYVQTNE